MLQSSLLIGLAVLTKRICCLGDLVHSKVLKELAYTAWVRQWTYVSIIWHLFAIIQLVPLGLELIVLLRNMTKNFDQWSQPQLKYLIVFKSNFTCSSYTKSLTVSDRLKQDTVCSFIIIIIIFFYKLVCSFLGKR